MRKNDVNRLITAVTAQPPRRDAKEKTSHEALEIGICQIAFVDERLSKICAFKVRRNEICPAINFAPQGL